MLDQNTTTVLTTAITVLGTLGGVVLGVVLSNRYVAREEKAKRNTAIIQEVYTLLANINARIIDNIDHKESFENIQDDFTRVEILVSLYFPSLKEKIHVL